MAGPLIAPSIISANFGALAEEVAKAERGGADMLHLDVMDGHFVPNITFGPLVVRAIHDVARLPLDVHLMIEDADRYIEAFAQAGASRISVHIEALPHLHRTVQLIKRFGVKAGVAFNPATPVDALQEIAADLDHVLLMSVNPGFSGQTFIPHSESKLRALRQLLARVGSSALVEVDGGIDLSNAARVVAAGADVLVSGQTVFGAANVEQAIRDLRAVAAGAIAK
jgi:ribulose-phosphate 3-epimerase